jgi:bacteriocin biosynthesis cyclodehydratase domain-containing protein
MRPLLRPGIHVLRRAPAELQVGLDPRQAVLLPATDAVSGTLALLRESAPREEYPDPRTLDLLDSHGMLVDAASMLPLVPAPAAPSGRPGSERSGSELPRAGRSVAGRVSRNDAAAIARAAGDDAPRRLRDRGQLRVQLVSFGGDLGRRLADRLAGLLGEAGIPVRRTSATEGGAAGRDALGVLAGVGEPQRELVDAWTRQDTPHLLLRMTEGYAALGPFVAPGRTACLRCVDAHATDADPAWPLLVAQYAAREAADRADGVPEPLDPLLASVAVAWAARDIASYAEGRRPGTWSTTIRLDTELAGIETQPWLRHPECGCSWD